MRNVIRSAFAVALALAITPAWAAMTKDEPTPPAASKVEQGNKERPAASDGSRVSGNMLKDDQDALRATPRSAKQARPASAANVDGTTPSRGRISGNMVKDDQDAARAAAERARP
jgi:hypothetical protein